MGSTRVLHDLVVEAQLAGALPLLIDAAAGGGPFAAVHQLIAKLLITAHDQVLAALTGHEAILARFSPTLRAALKVAPDATDFSLNPGEFRQRVLAALSDWLLRLCQERALLIAVDNAQRLDDASAALFAALAGDVVPKRRLLLVVSVDPEQLTAAAPALRPLTQGNTRLSLRALSREDVTQLVRSWFGGAEHGERLAALLYRVSGGNPRACVELAEHLVRKRIVRDIQGAWVLPFALQENELPNSLQAVQIARLEALPEPERRIAGALAVHRGRMPLALCLEIAEAEQIAEPYAVIEALTREGLLTSAGKSYTFSYDALRQALLDSLSEERKRELHRRMGVARGSWRRLAGQSARRGLAFVARRRARARRRCAGRCGVAGRLQRR
jgi:predicted ATPase